MINIGEWTQVCSPFLLITIYMVAIFLVVLALTVLLNWYIILFGKKDINQLKTKLSIRKYLVQIEESIDNELGHSATTFVKLGFAAILVLLVIFNITFFVLSVLAIMLGVFLAKRSYQIGMISNVLNKIATYINRVR